jgi:hypothetical protein
LCGVWLFLQKNWESGFKYEELVVFKERGEPFLDLIKIFSVWDLAKVGFSKADCQANGITLDNDLVKCFGIVGLKQFGYTINDLTEVGIDLKSLMGQKQLNRYSKKYYYSGCSVSGLKEFGFTATDFRKIDVEVQYLGDAFAPLELYRGGYYLWEYVYRKF